jgi:retinol dehydrogenase 12
LWYRPKASPDPLCQDSKVYLACSPEEKATNSITSIRKAVPKSSGQLVFLSLDLADLTEVTAAAQRFLAQESILHVLFNDAGVMIGPANSPLKTVQA